VRSFVAIPMPAAAREALAQVQDDLPVGRKSDPATLHLTLAFLDDQPDEVLAAVDEALGALHWRGVGLELAGVGDFGGQRPRVLWAGVRATPALRALRARVRTLAIGSGVRLPRERFRPHVTLARLSKWLRPAETERVAEALARNSGFAAGPFRVGRIALYRSTLRRDGAVHEMLAEYRGGEA